MRSEKEVRHRVKGFLDVVINPDDNISDLELNEIRLNLDALLWVLEEYDGIPAINGHNRIEGDVNTIRELLNSKGSNK